MSQRPKWPELILVLLGHSLFFSFSVECVFWSWVGQSVGLKKKTKNKSQEVSEQEALEPQDDVKS